jgi:hypothetical protein
VTVESALRHDGAPSEMLPTWFPLKIQDLRSPPAVFADSHRR